jgi:prepilin-type N-terminal cleavage/methylation domain-containing protein
MKRTAFTLVELLVVVAIIGILLSLLLPAVQAAREAGRRASCQNNLRQLGLALHNFHGVHKALPASGWTTVGSGNPKGRFVGWRALALPYLEEAGLQQAYDFNLNWWEGGNVAVGLVSIDTFRCPSVPERMEVLSAVAKPPRPAMTFPRSLAPTDYEAIMGVQPSVEPSRYATQATNRSAMYRNSRVKMLKSWMGRQKRSCWWNAPLVRWSFAAAAYKVTWPTTRDKAGSTAKGPSALMAPTRMARSRARGRRQRPGR